MLRLTFFSKLDSGSYIISITNTTSKKTGALIRSGKFYFFGMCSFELAELVPFPYSRGLLVILIDSMIFLSPFVGVTRDVTTMSMSKVSFLAQLGSGILCH